MLVMFVLCCKINFNDAGLTVIYARRHARDSGRMSQIRILIRDSITIKTSSFSNVHSSSYALIGVQTLFDIESSQSPQKILLVPTLRRARYQQDTQSGPRFRRIGDSSLCFTQNKLRNSISNGELLPLRFSIRRTKHQSHHDRYSVNMNHQDDSQRLMQELDVFSS